jgi:hypothetical protein
MAKKKARSEQARAERAERRKAAMKPDPRIAIAKYEFAFGTTREWCALIDGTHMFAAPEGPTQLARGTGRVRTFKTEAAAYKAAARELKKRPPATTSTGSSTGGR